MMSSASAKKQQKQKNGDHKIRIAESHLSKIAQTDRAEKREPVELAAFTGHVDHFRALVGNLGIWRIVFSRGEPQTEAEFSAQQDQRR